MKNLKNFAILIGCLMAFLVFYLAFAWTEPSATPPAGNVPAPLNVSINAQAKEGSLIVGNNSAVTTGLIVRYGNVGIGTTNPGAKLDVVSGYQRIQFLTGTNTSSYVLSIGVNDDGVNISNNSTIRGFNFKNANGTLLTITSGGNVGIGTTNPSTSYKLDVNGNVRATGFYYTSDLALKTNIKPLENSLAKILQLQGVSFNWKDSGEPSIGLIVQEVEKIFPELVSGNEGSKTVDYGKLVPVLIEAIKEQQNEIEKLKLEIETLKSK